MSRTAAASKPAWITDRSPGTVIGRFVAKRTSRSAVFWALIFGAYVASKAIGYAEAYPTAAERAKVAVSFGNNIGLSALLGIPHRINTVPGGAAWNTLGAMIIVGAIWAFLLATKSFRGEEDAGRWEVLLTGPTTAKRAALNVLAGLGASLAAFYVVIAAAFILIGQVHSVGFGMQSALFFALAAVTPAIEFMAIGALASQLMPTRSRAAGLSAAIFGVFYLVRATADTTGAHWLLNVTPLGWIERLGPLYNPRPVWLLPIGGLTLALSGLTVYLAGRRDLGDSTFADRDMARPRTGLLNDSIGAAFRLTRGVTLGWLSAIGLLALFMGLLTKSAAQAFDDSQGAQHVVAKLAHTSQAIGAMSFLGVVFLMLMLLVMSYIASTVGAMREDEAEGYLDNFLVRPVSRWRWLLERALLTTAITVLASLLVVAAVWIGVASQHTGVAYHDLSMAGLNLLAPAALTFGIGIFALGVLPRLTTVIAYGVIAWSFLISMVSSGINLNHWIQDTSILHHMALAPATAPDWGTDIKLVGLGILLALAGAWAFNSRDLQAE
jgi:ABC-2 type transport system permease protein